MTEFKNKWVGLPEVKPKFDIPVEFRIEVPEDFKKIPQMGKVEMECNDTIDRLIGYKYIVEKKTDQEIASDLNVTSGKLIRNWREKLGIRRSKIKIPAAA